MKDITTKNILSYLIILLGLSLLVLILKDVNEVEFLFSGFMLFIPSTATLIYLVVNRIKLQLNLRISNYLLILASLFAPFVLELLTDQILVFLDYTDPFCKIANFSIPTLSAALLIILISVGEEIGIRGIVQEFFTNKYGVVIGITIVGLIWSLWRTLFLVLPNSSVDNFLLNSGYILIFSLLYSVSVGMFYKIKNNLFIPITFSVSTYYTFLLSNNFSLVVESSAPALLVRLGLWVLLVEVSLWMFLSKEK